MLAHALTVKPPGFYSVHHKTRSYRRHFSVSVTCCRVPEDSGLVRQTKRRHVLITPFLAVGAYVFRDAVARADESIEKRPSEVETVPRQPQQQEEVSSTAETDATSEVEVEEELVNSRIYDATVIGEPMAMGKDKSKVWDKVMSARLVYLGEAEQVPIGDDKDLELEIVKSLRKRCVEAERTLSLALEAFPCDLQEQLDLFVDNRINAETLKSFVTHWPPERWQEYEPLLTYCCNNGIRLVACGVPLEVLRTVQAEGVRGLSVAARKKFAPPAGTGFISGFPSISKRSPVDVNFLSQSAPYGSRSFLSKQARVVEDYTMSQIISQVMTDCGPTGMIVVVTGASHVAYGSRGIGLPARISIKMQKKDQVIILLNPERQSIRREGDTPVADFLWYSAARPCNRNCFDRAEIARVMNAAGGRRDALPQDLQKGLDLGVVSPEVLQNFFDLEKNPVLSGLTHRFQGFRERLLADPKFLNRLAIEEAISISTTLLAQYERRKENFFQELDYVATDTLRGIVVDFFTVWLPAPTLSFTPFVEDINAADGIEAVKGLLGSIPDNAFQKNLVGKDWNLNHRIASVLVGGLKLASVGFISSIGTVASANMLLTVRRLLNPSIATEQQNKRSPILKTALVYSGFLGTSANLRYQVIAGIVEHRISDQFSNQTFLVNLISFVARTANSYWGTQQWIDLARYTGLQARKSDDVPFQIPDSTNSAALECNILEETSIDESNKQ